MSRHGSLTVDGLYTYYNRKLNEYSEPENKLNDQRSQARHELVALIGANDKAFANGMNANGYTRAMSASYHDNPAVLSALIRKGADINARGQGTPTIEHWTPVRCTLNNAAINSLKLLINNRANLLVRDRYGATLLHEASLFDRRDRCREVYFSVLTEALLGDWAHCMSEEDRVEAFCDVLVFEGRQRVPHYHRYDTRRSLKHDTSLERLICDITQREPQIDYKDAPPVLSVAMMIAWFDRIPDSSVEYMLSARGVLDDSRGLSRSALRRVFSLRNAFEGWALYYRDRVVQTVQEATTCVGDEALELTLGFAGLNVHRGRLEAKRALQTPVVHGTCILPLLQMYLDEIPLSQANPEGLDVDSITFSF